MSRFAVRLLTRQCETMSSNVHRSSGSGSNGECQCLTLRLRVVRDVEAGSSRRSVAFKYAVSISFVIKLVQRWRAAGTVAPRGTGGRKVHALAAHAALVDRLLASKRDITLDELRLGLLGEGVLVGRSSIDRYLKARGLTRKNVWPAPFASRL